MGTPTKENNMSTTHTTTLHDVAGADTTHDGCSFSDHGYGLTVRDGYCDMIADGFDHDGATMILDHLADLRRRYGA